MATEETIRTSRTDYRESPRQQQENDENESEEPQWRRVKARSSDLFDRIMSDYETKMQERLRKQYEAMQAAKQKEGEQVEVETLEIIEDDIESEEEEVEEVEEIDPHKEHLRKIARRAWGLIRRYINEQAVQKKNQKSGMNWSFLKQTLSGMTNMEKAREDLYKKYLHDDPREWTKGLSYIPEHIFNKARVGTRKSGITDNAEEEKKKGQVRPTLKGGKRSSGVKSK